MDIINRLNQFVLSTGRSSSQFADEISIPRPSFSQIINGRNKKLSNELIEKLHIAFPNLNILWLLFGEGNMILDDNKDNIPTTSPADINDSLSSDNSQKNQEEAIISDSILPRDSVNNITTDFSPFHTSEKNLAEEDKTTQVPAKIKSVIVLYSDDSFKIYNPR